MKKISTITRQNSKSKVILKPTPKESSIKGEKNLLINNEYLKNFINFDIIIETEEKPKTLNEPKLIKAKEEDFAMTSLKNIQKIFSETENKMKELKEEFEKSNFSESLGENKENESSLKISRISQKSQNTQNTHNTHTKTKQTQQNFSTNNILTNEEVNILKCELINLKMKLVIEKVKSKFYENIFYTCKNCIENTQIKEKSEKNETDKLLQKLNEIFTQNNKYYYETFDAFHVKNYTKNVFDTNITLGDLSLENSSINKINHLHKIENNLQLLMMKMNSLLECEINKNCLSGNELLFQYQNISHIRDFISLTLKKVLSYYLLNDDLTFEFTQRSKFLLDLNSFGLSQVKFEVKERDEKILQEFEKFLNSNVNRIMNIKTKNELLEKIKVLNNFHENFYVLVRNDNLNIKSNSEIYVSNSNTKISKIKTVVESFLNFAENSIEKIKEMIDLLQSKNLKQVDKVIHSFLMKEENNFVELIEKFEDLKKSYHLIK